MAKRNPNETVRPQAAPPPAARRGRGRPPGSGGGFKGYVPGKKSRYMWRVTPCKNAAEAQAVMQDLSDQHYMIKNSYATTIPGEPVHVVWCHYEGSGPEDRRTK